MRQNYPQKILRDFCCTHSVACLSSFACGEIEKERPAYSLSGQLDVGGGRLTSSNSVDWLGKGKILAGCSSECTDRNDVRDGVGQGPLNGGVSDGGVSRSGLVLPFLSFLGLSRFFWDFPDLLGDGPGIFPISSFPLSRPIKSTCEEQSRKGPRHNLDLSPKKVGNTRVWKPPGLASLK